MREFQYDNCVESSGRYWRNRRDLPPVTSLKVIPDHMTLQMFFALNFVKETRWSGTGVRDVFVSSRRID